MPAESLSMAPLYPGGHLRKTKCPSELKYFKKKKKESKEILKSQNLNFEQFCIVGDLSQTSILAHLQMFYDTIRQQNYNQGNSSGGKQNQHSAAKAQDLEVYYALCKMVSKAFALFILFPSLYNLLNTYDCSSYMNNSGQW